MLSYCLLTHITILFQVIEHLSVPHMEASETDPHVLRVGWSLDSTSLQLGMNFYSVKLIII